MKKAAESEETMFTAISSFNQSMKLWHTEPPRPRWHVTSGCRFNILWHKILSSALMGYLHVIPTLFHDHLLSLSLSHRHERKTRLRTPLCLLSSSLLLMNHKNTSTQRNSTRLHCSTLLCFFFAELIPFNVELELLLFDTQKHGEVLHI